MATHRKYPPELLAELAAESRSINEMLRRLGLPIIGGHHTHISRQVQRLGIDTSHFTHLGKHHKRHTYTREELAEAAARSSSVPEMLRFLGVEPYPSAYGYIRKRCADFGIDVSHFTTIGMRHTVDPDALRKAVAESRSVAGVARALGLSHGTNSYRLVRRWASEHSVDLSGLPGQGHNKGRRAPKLGAADILRHDPGRDRRTKVHQLRRALAEIGRAPKCVVCGIGAEWNGKPIILEVDHINGDWRDNRPDNLRYLCPNCHSQTDTFCGRNSSLASRGTGGTPLR
ncbi:HNH endonuclease signature motif containing protein [Yinghuangia sp. YIM S09857]|uniref:HNH endonuclease signature motif containing protein n=1 Tax=Yinghuangia sp. YIM S09857 TaxID=3436929 RepID=UPI003F52BB6C